MLNKIKNNIFLKSTLLLLIGGSSTRIVGFILKIIITRTIGSDGITLYSLLNPTISFLTVLSIFSYPSAISKIISEKSDDPNKLFPSIIPFSIFTNIILILIVIFFSPILSNNLLNEPKLYFPIICISFTLPFISISSIIKGYFWGKQNMWPYMLSNFFEQVTRLILISLFLLKIVKINLIYSICFIILVNILGEIVSQIIMIKFSPKKKLILKNYNFQSIKNVMNFSIPSTTSKVIGSFSYFLEPIVLTNILLFVGYDRLYIIHEYGIINAYAMSILLMPQFLTQNMSTSLIPELSKHYSLGNKKLCIKRIKQIVIFSLLIGLISTIVIFIFPKFILKIIYNTSEGIEYIRLLSPFIILYYIEYPLTNALQALGQVKKSLYVTITNSIIRLLSIVILSLLKIGIYSYILSIIINLVCSTILYFIAIKKTLK